MNTKEDIIRKVQKLMAVADPDKNTFEAEMANALRLAKKLMAEHDLEMSDISVLDADGVSNTNFEVEQGVAYDGQCNNYHYTLMCAVDNLCGVKHFRRKQRNGTYVLIFFGTTTDVSMAREMFTLLLKLGKEKATLYAGSGKLAHRSYCAGFFRTIHNRSVEDVKMDTDEQQQCHALVVINKEQILTKYAENVLHLQHGRLHRGSGVDFDAFAQGQRDGRTVSLATKGLLS